VEYGADINKEDNNGATQIFDGNEFVVKFLVENGVDINKEVNNGETPTFYAYLSENKHLVRYLVEHDTNINWEANNVKHQYLEPVIKNILI